MTSSICKTLTALSLTLTLAFTSSNTSAKELVDAPQWQLTKQNGEPISLEQYEGKPVILHFWATWCSYCKRLQPKLVALQEKYKESGVELVSISFEEDKGIDPQAEITDRGYDFVTAIKGEKVAELYDVNGTPTTFFINRDGKIIYKSTSSRKKHHAKLEKAMVAITKA